MERIALSLAGHTNFGKTTLARTLLCRDIGEVDDRPHVTDIAEAHVLVGDAEAEIVLWDLPGFGDSVKLLRRLRSEGWLAWFRHVFDRWKDRSLWCSRECVRNAREHADIVLYLVDAQHDPAGSPEVKAEMEILEWVGKPVVLLLNQTGLPDAVRDAALAARWRAALAPFGVVRDALPLDGWVRCWVQEVRLMERVGRWLPEGRRETFARLVCRWAEDRHQRPFRESVRLLAGDLAETACDAAVVERESIGERIAGAFVGRLSSQRSAARKGLAERLITRSRRTMEALIALHGLEGVPRHRIDAVVAGLKERNPAAPPELWALLGGIGSGALGGLVADFKSGGLTFGGGAVLGALGGGLAAYALGYGYRLASGDDGRTRMRWSRAFLRDELRAAALRYLVVAHMGRGRGRWHEPLPGELPGRWRECVDAWIASHHRRTDDAFARGGGPESVRRALEPVVETLLRHVLDTMYPGAGIEKTGPSQ